jgi:hypothetical protein
LDTLADGLWSLQTLAEGRADHGALICPVHGLHTRAGEAAFPLAYAARKRGDLALLERSLLLADWLVAQQRPDGAWEETPDDWTGTSVFQLMSLAALVDLMGDGLDPGRRTLYHDSIRRAADWAPDHMGLRKATTNYVASAAAALTLAGRALNEDQWRRTARHFAREAAGMIQDEGLVRGEGLGRRFLKKIYIKPKGVDIGYGLEMTLGALALYSRLADDPQVAQRLELGLDAHLWFIDPDGGLDNSLGSRGYKWTMYGSKTAHGSQMALAYGARFRPDFKAALERTTRHLAGYVHDGLLASGPCPEKPVREECPYPTIVRAVNLALALFYFPESGVQAGKIPADREPWCKNFSELGSYIIRRGPFMATVSGYRNRTRFPGDTGPITYSVPAGGTITHLHVQGYGPLQAATHLVYHPFEPLHLPPPGPQTLSFCPRLRIHRDGATGYSILESRPIIDVEEAPGETIVRCRGRFISPNPAGRHPASWFRAEYRFTAGGLSKSMVGELAPRVDVMSVVEPLVLLPGASYRAIPGGVSVTRGRVSMAVLARDEQGKTVDPSEIRAIRCPLPALEGLALIWRPAPKPETFLRVEFQVPPAPSAETS